MIVTTELLDAIRRFPVERAVQHCGVQWTAPALDFYSECPKCGTRIKLRSFSASGDIEDVFDAVLEWMNQPTAGTVAQRRQQALAEDADS
jgi:hypothetical protein